MGIQQLTLTSDYNKFISEKPYTVVIHTAPWCTPCKAIMPVLEKLSNEYKQICFLKVDIDKFSEISRQENVSSIPSFKFYSSGVKVHEFIGADRQNLENTVKKMVSQNEKCVLLATK